jgi:hypothetical protein
MYSIGEISYRPRKEYIQDLPHENQSEVHHCRRNGAYKVLIR